MRLGDCELSVWERDDINYFFFLFSFLFSFFCFFFILFKLGGRRGKEAWSNVVSQRRNVNKVVLI